MDAVIQKHALEFQTTVSKLVPVCHFQPLKLKVENVLKILNQFVFNHFFFIQGDRYVFEMRSPPRAAYIATALSFDVS